MLPVLLDVIQDVNHPSRIRALAALSRTPLPPELAIPALVRVLWDNRPARVEAAEILGRMGPDAKPAIAALENLLKGSAPEARTSAALALWKIDHRGKEAVRVLVSQLKNTTTLPQGQALTFPGRFGASGLPVPPCQQAAEALGQMGPDAEAAVPALIQVLKERQFAASSPAFALALRKIRPAEAQIAVPALLEGLEGKGPAARLSWQAAAVFRRQTAAALGQILTDGAEAVPALTKALGDADAGVRQEAAKALGNMGRQAREARRSLEKALTDPDEGVRSEATAALKKLAA